MTLSTVQVGNYCFKVIVNVTDAAGAARDLTGATTLKIKLKCITGQSAGKIFDAVLEDAVGGSLSYVITADDIDEIGTWQAQGFYTLSGWVGHTEPVDVFEVEGNLA